MPPPLPSRTRPGPVRAVALAFGGALLTATSASAQVSGVVVDQSSLLPVEGVRVTLQATTTSDTTLADGSFALSGVSGTDQVIVGAKEGYFHGVATVDAPASGVQIEIRTVPQEDDTSYVFQDPNACGACHDVQAAQFAGSPMALAGQDLWVYDIYDGTGTAGGMGGFVYTRDGVHSGTNPNSECASCHQPESWIREPFRALEDIGSLSNNAMHGVSCEVCHKIAHIDETKFHFPGIYPGVVTFTRPSAATGQVQYGVLGDVSFNVPDFMQPSYQPQLPSEVCAACHEDRNDPDQDGEFEEPNGIESEPTYDEWDASPYGDPQSPLFATCVDCHMPSYGAIHVCNVVPPDRDPETIRGHDIRGTSPAFLENAVTMIASGDVQGDSLHVQVWITNDLTGHHVPTGVSIRNVILLVEAWREGEATPLPSSGSQVVHDLGGIGDPAQGYYAGLPGKLYAKVLADSAGGSPVFFTEAVSVELDSRIPALATDVTTYAFALPPEGGTFHVRARLIYRRAFRDLVDQKGWTVDGFGAPLEDIAPPDFGHLMEEEEFLLVIETGVVSPAAAGASLELYPARPNPARVNTQIRFRLPSPGDVRLVVFDLQGRRVATLLEGRRGAGEHGLVWSGRDDGGRPVASGVYLVRLEAGGARVASRRLTWLR